MTVSPTARPDICWGALPVEGGAAAGEVVEGGNLAGRALVEVREELRDEEEEVPLAVGESSVILLTPPLHPH